MIAPPQQPAACSSTSLHRRGCSGRNGSVTPVPGRRPEPALRRKTSAAGPRLRAAEGMSVRERGRASRRPLPHRPGTRVREPWTAGRASPTRQALPARPACETHSSQYPREPWAPRWPAAMAAPALSPVAPLRVRRKWAPPPPRRRGERPLPAADLEPARPPRQHVAATSALDRARSWPRPPVASRSAVPARSGAQGTRARRRRAMRPARSAATRWTHRPPAVPVSPKPAVPSCPCAARAPAATLPAPALRSAALAGRRAPLQPVLQSHSTTACVHSAGSNGQCPC